MKYKLIKSMARNFTHSFVGGGNYVDDAFIFEDLYTLARLNKGKPVQISWVPARTEELFRLTPRIRKSIGYYREWLPKHSASHNVSLVRLKEFYLQVYIAKNHQVYVKAITVDERGKRVEQYVYA
ncbi:TPA: hypothetical protein NJ353_002746 [Vibrio parahaemolyticus]|nr:hypothetical protein [Vibrio parahaemolyticus]HCG7082312.1 hypothetical protein [Vibrio parahaemolyticus]HCH0793946.1 hypothetical protein [Vibrio parahaemolyticus]HCH1054544.1 hypothetical protein [Vibrio parahaemolyticus]HCM1204852.1 hypothetical protein [Vibrio parahaemolyticus]